MSEQLTLAGPSIHDITGVVAMLSALDITPTHLRVDWHHVTDTRPDISIWTKTRADFEAVCAELKAKPHERLARARGQREFYAHHDTDTRRLLIQCCSFPHHDDWEEA